MLYYSRFIGRLRTSEMELGARNERVPPVRIHNLIDGDQFL